MKKRNVGIAVSYGNTFVTAISGFILSTILLRSLGDIEYGLYQTVASFATYLVMLEFGTGTAMSRGIVVYKNSDNKDRVKNCIATVWFMTVALAILILAVAVVFMMNIGNIYRLTMTAEQVVYAQKLFAALTAYLLLNYFKQALNGVLLGMEQYSFASIVNIAHTVLRTVLIVLLVLFKPCAMTIVIVDAIVGFISFSVTFIYCKKEYKLDLKLRYFEKSLVIEFLPLCVALLLQSLVNQANNSVDKFIIGIKMDLVSVSIYSVAQYIYSVFSSVVTIPITMFLPQVGKDIAAGNEGKRLTDTLVQPSRFVSLLGGSLLFGFFAVGRQFVSFFYGESKESTWIYSLIILVPMFINATNGVLVNVLDIKNKRQVRSRALAVTTVINIVLTVWFISLWGIIGAVIATAIATVLGQILFMNYYYAKKMDIKIMYLYKQAYRGILVYQVISSVAAFFVARLFTNNLVAFLVGGVMYVLMSGGLILCFGLDDEERKVVKKVLHLEQKQSK